MPTNKIQRIPIPASIEVSRKARILRSQGVDIIDLSVGQPNHNPPINDSNIEHIFSYSDCRNYGSAEGESELRSAICRRVYEQHQVSLSTAQVVVTPGLKLGIHYLFTSLLEPDDEVIVPTPCWLSYGNLVDISGGKTVFIKSTEANNFISEVEHIEQAITPRTKAIIISNPVNPSGSFWDKESLAQLVDISTSKGIYLIVDGIYEDFDFYDSLTPLSELIDELDNKYFIYLSGFSKSFAVPGLRIGYVLASEKIAKLISKCQSQLMTCPGVLDQSIALNLLKNFSKRRFSEAMKHYSGKLNESKMYLENNDIGYVSAKGTFYLLIKSDFIDKSSVKASLIILNSTNVATVPGIAYGNELDSYVRLSLTDSRENIMKALQRIRLLR